MFPRDNVYIPGTIAVPLQERRQMKNLQFLLRPIYIKRKMIMQTLRPNNLKPADLSEIADIERQRKLNGIWLSHLVSPLK